MGTEYDHHLFKEDFRTCKLNGTLSQAIRYLQRIKKRLGNTPLYIQFLDDEVHLYRPATKEERKEEKKRLAKESEEYCDEQEAWQREDIMRSMDNPCRS